MKKILYLVLIIAVGCREVYNAPVKWPDAGYLVVEGFINSAGVTTIKLSRATKLSDGPLIVYENNAAVIIEGDNSESYSLFEATNGTYVSNNLNLTQNVKYRLHIKTQNGKEYLSDYSEYRLTPPIDSLTWKREGGVQVYVNTHDPSGSSKYFQWQYEETWEFHSAYQSSLQYVIDPVTQTPTEVTWRDSFHTVDEKLYRCWKSNLSTELLVGTTEKLSSDVVYVPIVNVPPASEQISVLYSVNVKQFALSRENYDFLQKMKKNTEQLGSIFDAQPTELQGNIHCTSDAKETVVGYIDVSQEQSKRIFISNAEVPDWNYLPPCDRTEVKNTPADIQAVWDALVPTVPSQLDPLGGILAFYASAVECVDCVFGGRTNVKPDFWP